MKECIEKVLSNLLFYWIYPRQLLKIKLVSRRFNQYMSMEEDRYKDGIIIRICKIINIKYFPFGKIDVNNNGAVEINYTFVSSRLTEFSNGHVEVISSSLIKLLYLRRILNGNPSIDFRLEKNMEHIIKRVNQMKFIVSFFKIYNIKNTFDNAFIINVNNDKKIYTINTRNETLILNGMYIPKIISKSFEMEKETCIDTRYCKLSAALKREKNAMLLDKFHNRYILYIKSSTYYYLFINLKKYGIKRDSIQDELIKRAGYLYLDRSSGDKLIKDIMEFIKRQELSNFISISIKKYEESNVKKDQEKKKKGTEVFSFSIKFKIYFF